MLKILQISTTLLVSFAGIIFAYAEGSPLGAVSLFVALFALYFIDWQKAFFANNTLASILGLVAFIVAGMEFFNGEIESRLLSGGHLIVYLTWVFLVQKKESRHYWWLFALGILQVAVAAVLTNGIWYGAALASYSFLACWTLSVFQLYRATSDHLAPTTVNQPRLVVGSTRKGISRDVDHSLLDLRFFSTTSFVYTLSLGMAILFFLFTPRVWIGRYSTYGDSPVAGKPLTGFTEEVRLGDMGEILENNANVATVELFHHQTGVRFTEKETLNYLGADPLFRGATQEIYDSGRWTHDNQESRDASEINRDALIRQQITLEPIGVRTLFGYGNVVTMFDQDTSELIYRPISGTYLRQDGNSSGAAFTYQVLANPGSVDSDSATQRQRWSNRRLFRFGDYLLSISFLSDEFTRIRNISENVTKNTSSSTEATERIEAFLRDSGEFSYSLKLSIQDASIDPVEDFLINRKQGHCEYFASAMVLMLRGKGIPSRLVTGFKGGVQKRNKLTIQQLHAHSWVEAYLDGQWHTYDPTPGARNTSVSSMEGPPSMFFNMKQNISNYWSAGLQMSPTQQKEKIYKPIEDVFAKIGDAIKEIFDGNLSSLTRYFEFLKSPRRWFSWQGGVFVFLSLLIISGVVWCVKKIVRFLKRNWKQQRTQRKTYQQVEFYNRFRKIMQAQGYSQQPTQTAQEFVATSLKTLQPQLTEIGLDDWSQELVQKFYQVRFGNEPLSENDAAKIDDQLSKMEATFTQSPATR